MRYIIEETVVSKTTRLHVIEAPTVSAAEILAAGEEPALTNEIEKHDVQEYHDVTKSQVRQIELNRTFEIVHNYTDGGG